MSTQTALLVIDAQVGLLDKAYRRDDIVATIADLIARARASGAPVIYVQHDGDADGDLAVGSPGWRIHPALAPRDGDPIVRKRSSDSFYGTPLQQELDARGIGRLIVGGMKTEMCVDTTSRAAVSRGYDVTLAADAHTTTDTDALPAARMIAYHNEILDDFGNDDHVVTAKDARAIALQPRGPDRSGRAKAELLPPTTRCGVRRRRDGRAGRASSWADNRGLLDCLRHL